MDTTIKLIGLWDIFILSLFMMIPGQCFWVGLSIAKKSMSNAIAYLMGSATGDILVYGALNEFGTHFLEHLNHGIMNLTRGVILIVIGCLTLHSLWISTTTSEVKQLFIHSGSYTKQYILGISLVLTNPMVYALLIPYSEPLVKLQHHWLLYAIFMSVILIPSVYMLVYSTAYKLDRVLTNTYGKLFWSAIAIFPIYYGVDVLRSVW